MNIVNTARMALLALAVSFGQQALATTDSAADAKIVKFDLSPNRERIHAPRNDTAIGQIPPGFKFARPGKFTVGVTAGTYPPLGMLADDDKTSIGSEPDIAQLVADSLGLELVLVQTSWEDWPLGVSSGKYDAVLSNVTVTEARKKRFDFATYRQDVLGFYVKTSSKIQSIKEAKDIAGLKIIVGSGTNQEKVLLAWNEANEKAGIKPAFLQYYDDSAAAQLAVQSGRADANFGPNATGSYSAALTGGTRLVGVVNGGWPLQADIAVTTRKGNGLVTPVHTALQGVIAGGQYDQVLQRWRLEAERVDESKINPPGLPD